MAFPGNHAAACASASPPIHPPAGGILPFPEQKGKTTQAFYFTKKSFIEKNKSIFLGSMVVVSLEQNEVSDTNSYE